MSLFTYRILSISMDTAVSREISGAAVFVCLDPRQFPVNTVSWVSACFIKGTANFAKGLSWRRAQEVETLGMTPDVRTFLPLAWVIDIIVGRQFLLAQLFNRLPQTLSIYSWLC